MEWTEKQKEAIETRGKNVLVAAAAGSGKTAVLTERILRHVMDDDFDLSKILVVTFTKAAAAEMRQRLEKKITENISVLETETSAGENKEAEKKLYRLKRQLLLLDSADISTIDSFCKNVIKREGAGGDDAVDVSSRIADEEELQFIKQEVIEDIFLSHYEQEDDEFLRFAGMYGNDKGDDSLYELVLDLSDFAESEPDPEYWLKSLSDDYEGISTEIINSAETIGRPEMKANRWMKCLRENIARLLVKVRELIESCISRAELIDTENSHKYADFVREEYRDVLNDEYQLLLRNIDKKSWDEIRAFVQGIVPVVLTSKGTASRAPGFTGEGSGKAEIEAIKNLRKDAANILKEVLQGNLLSNDSATIAYELTLMGGYVKVLAGLAIDFRQKFSREKAERHIMDFGDVEHLALDIIGYRDGHGGYSGLTEAGKRIRNQYREIMVDEYQDVNHLQETMFTLLSRSEYESEETEESLPCRFIVGDVKQSIYRFRHSDPNLFNNKKAVYGESGQTGPCCRVDMSDNYRSRSSVLKAINYIFKQFMSGAGTEIVYDDCEALHYKVDSENDNGYPVSGEAEFLDDKTELAIVESSCEESEVTEDDKSNRKKSSFEYEADYIARRIESLLSSGVHIWPDKTGENHRAIEPKDIVILMRSISGRSEILREQLKSRNIRTYVTVDAGYFEAPEINTVVSLMRVIDNAHQDIPLAAVLRSPIGKFSDEELVRLRLFNRHERFFFDVLKSAAAFIADGVENDFIRAEFLTEELHLKVKKFLSKLKSWRTAARELSLGELIWQLMRETNYYEYVGALPGGQLRQANLRLLIDRAKAYESADNRGLFRFLHFIELLKKGKTDLSQARTLGENENVVRIMTIHKSKGMEFPVVILAGMGKQFNTQDEKRTFIYHKELGIGGDIIVTARQLSGKDSDDDLLRMKKTAVSKDVIKLTLNREMKAEELRLLYVALTRAKEKLIMTGSVKDFEKAAIGWNKYNIAALDSFDKEAVKPLNESSVMEAKSMLDWVATALSNHVDGVCFHPEELPSQFYSDGSRFSVDVISVSGDDDDIDSGNTSEISEEDNEIRISGREFLASVKSRNPLLKDRQLDADSEKLAKEIEELLLYNYPDCGTEGMRSKISVTELKHRAQLEEQRAANDSAVPEAAGAGEELIEQENEFRISSLLANSGGVDEKEDRPSEEYIGGPLFGTAVHGILQQIVTRNIRKGSSELAEIIEATVKNTVGPKIDSVMSRFVSKAERYVNGFIDSDLGRRVMAARALGAVHCELPFIRLLNVEEAFPEKFVNCGNDKLKLPKIFLQGIIDLLFEEDGHYILLDYKTDRNIDGKEAIDRYHKQLELYKESIEMLTGRPVDEAYLFLLDRKEAVRFYAK